MIMHISEIFHKTITNIYLDFYTENDWEFGTTYIELDGSVLITIPWNDTSDPSDDEAEPDWQIEIYTLPESAKCLTDDLSDITWESVHFDVNVDGLTMQIAMTNYQWLKWKIYYPLRKFLLGLDIPEYYHCTMEHRENELKYIKNRKIVDYLWHPDSPYEAGLFLLDNGWLISSCSDGPPGVGSVGLYHYKNIGVLRNIDDIKSYQTQQGSG